MNRLPLLLLLLATTWLHAEEIRPKVVVAYQPCGDDCCHDRRGWLDQWAVYHPVKLGFVSTGDNLPASWVVKRTKPCCPFARYDVYQVTTANDLDFAITCDGYRTRADSPRIPPVFADYWPTRAFPDWFTAGDYFYFVRIQPSNPEQQCSWWISADGREWELLEAGELVADPHSQRKQTLGGPPRLPLPPARRGLSSIE